MREKDGALGPLPDDVAAVRAALDACARQAGELLASDDATLDWPAEGAWSIAQGLDHLATANLVYLAPMRDAAARAQASGALRRGPIAPGVFARMFIWSLEPPVRTRMKAPGKIRPAAQVERAVLTASFQQAHADVTALLLEAAHLDLNRARFANPFIRGVRMSLGSAFLILAAHERRHLWQAENVRRQASAVV